MPVASSYISANEQYIYTLPSDILQGILNELLLHFKMILGKTKYGGEIFSVANIARHARFSVQIINQPINCAEEDVNRELAAIGITGNRVDHVLEVMVSASGDLEQLKGLARTPFSAAMLSSRSFSALVASASSPI